MKKQKFLLFFLVLIICFTVFWTGDRPLSDQKGQQQEPITETGFYLNTVVTITIYDSQDTSLLKDCMEICQNYEKQFSRTISTSEVARLNHGELTNAQGVSHLSEETAELVQKSLDFAQLSDGAFDPTIGPVSSLWDFTSEEHELPSDSDIQANLPLVSYEKVSLNGQDISFSMDGMQLDLGAIAKGYIADHIKEYLLSQNIQSATINLGGNVLCIGSKPDSSPFRVGIQKPFDDRNTYIAVVEVTDGSVVTSGNYERYFEKDGKLYHHILNPSTGYPYENGLTSVTILSEISVDGDGLSTSCYALGLEKGMELIEKLPGVEALFITEDGEMHYSENFPRSRE